MDSLFEVTFNKLEDTGKYLSKCGKCRRYMKFVPLRPQRLFCPTCNVTYSLPQNGTIKLFKEVGWLVHKCVALALLLRVRHRMPCLDAADVPVGQFPTRAVLAWQLRLVTRYVCNAVLHVVPSIVTLIKRGDVSGKSTPLCPYCYNNPPFEGVKAMSCDLCQHPSCKWSAARNAVCRCPGEAALAAGEGGDDGPSGHGGHRGHHGRGAGGRAGAGADSARCPGMLVFDPNSKPNWKLACNRCSLIVGFHGTIHKMTPLREVSVCSCRVCAWYCVARPVADFQCVRTSVMSVARGSWR